MKELLGGYIILVIILACGHQPGKNETPNDNSKKEDKPLTKPPTIFSDTLKIESKAAVFYYPDSVQLQKIKAASSDTAVFDAVMHEYFNQVRFVHSVLEQSWPHLKVIEAKNIRYLVFEKADNTISVIDLDKKYDPYGLIVFDPQWEPSQLDMTNAESQIGFYFNR